MPNRQRQVHRRVPLGYIGSLVMELSLRVKVAKYAFFHPSPRPGRTLRSHPAGQIKNAWHRAGHYTATMPNRQRQVRRNGLSSSFRHFSPFQCLPRRSFGRRDRSPEEHGRTGADSSPHLTRFPRLACTSLSEARPPLPSHSVPPPIANGHSSPSP